MSENWFTKNISGILTIGSIVGTAATAVAAAHNTMKAAEVIKAKEREDERQYTVKEKFKLGWKHYIPTGVCFAATVGMAIASHGISAAEIAALGTAAGYVTKNRDKIKAKFDEVVKTLPQSQQEDIRSTLLHDIKHGLTPPEYEKTGFGMTKVIDLYSGRTFLSSVKEVKAGIERFLKRWHDGEYLCLSDLYEEWHISRTTFGYQFGWPNGVVRDEFGRPKNVDKDGDPMCEVYFDDVLFDINYNEEEGILYVDINHETLPIDYWMEV